jgi:hypothetical protein
MPTFRNHLSVPSSKAGDEWKWVPVFIPGTRCTGSGGTNGEGGSGWGGSEWVSWCGGGSIREVVRSFEAFEDGINRWFRNVGMQIQTPGIHPKDYSQYPKHGESLKSRITIMSVWMCLLG